jgi:sugar-specific transcriptional regulator TrmB
MQLKLSKDWMQKTLIKLGFTETDAQVYIYLTTEGPRKAKDIAEALNLHRQKLYCTLKNLQNKAIVNASLEHPAQFSAVLFEKILDRLIEAKMEQQQALADNKKELLATWRTITKKNTPKS